MIAVNDHRVPRRIWVTGSSGAGKTTLSRRLAIGLELDHVEMDGLFHGPDWTPAEADVLRARVAPRLAAPAWVVDGNYRSRIEDLVSARADLRVALDPSTIRVMTRVVRRTLRRVVTREELWNGNREPFSNLTRWDPEQNIIRWAWVHRHTYHRQCREAEKDAREGAVPCVRLTSPSQVRRFVRYLGA